MRYILGYVLALLLWGCSTSKNITVSNDLYTKEQEWPVTVKDGWLTAKTITFGPYSTTPRKNGLAEPTFIKSPKDPFNFFVDGNGEHILVQTLGTSAVAFTSKNLPYSFNTLAPNTAIRYTLINGTSQHPLNKWEMIVKTAHYLELNSNKTTGVLRSSDREFRITAHNHFGKVNSYENICYEFYSNGKLIAAVMPGEHPKVWMDKNTDSETSNVLAAAIAAFLL